jgi:hypothetical protein
MRNREWDPHGWNSRTVDNGRRTRWYRDHVCDSRCSHKKHYSHHCDSHCRHLRFAFHGPYGPVYVPIYVPTPIFIYEPATEVVVLPAPEPPRYQEPAPERPVDDRVAGPLPLEDVIANLERAWEEGNLALLMQHVALDGSVEIYQGGELLYRLTREEFRQRNLDAFRLYKTSEMRFGRPNMVSDTEAVAVGLHVFRDDQGEERRVRVIYAFRLVNNTWWVSGIDFSRDANEQGAEQPAAEQRQDEPDPRAEIRGVSVLWARKIRVDDLLKLPTPIRVATLRYEIGDAHATYDLEAMRGIVPHTLAWVLYHRGDQLPVEAGMVEVGMLDPTSWVSIRVLPVAAPGGDAAPEADLPAAMLPLEWIATGQTVALDATMPPLTARR